MSEATAHETDRKQALVQAADAARFAPSIHNTQPWRWVVHPDRLELFGVAERQLKEQDPDGHMLLVSCGTALRYAQVALAARNWDCEIDRPAGEPLAVLRATGYRVADADDVRRADLLAKRHTDRRTAGDEPIAPDVLGDLVAATERGGARLHLLRRDQVIDLAVAVEHAEKAQGSDERLQRDMADWIGGDRPGGTGIPDANLPQEQPATTVAERDFGASGTLEAGEGHDGAATYGVLYGAGDEPADWLCAGEALSALWLAAIGHGVTLLPVSSPAEVPFTRQELQRLLGGVGFPYLALRLGTAGPAGPEPAATPRLAGDQVIEFAD